MARKLQTQARDLLVALVQLLHTRSCVPNRDNVDLLKGNTFAVLLRIDLILIKLGINCCLHGNIFIGILFQQTYV